jgi:hypothetical protein
MYGMISRRNTPTTQKALPELSIRDLTGLEFKDVRDYASALPKCVNDGVDSKFERWEADLTTNIEHRVVGH